MASLLHFLLPISVVKTARFDLASAETALRFGVQPGRLVIVLLANPVAGS